MKIKLFKEVSQMSSEEKKVYIESDSSVFLRNKHLFSISQKSFFACSEENL